METIIKKRKKIRIIEDGFENVKEYKTIDGKIFSDKKTAEIHENKTINLKKLKEKYKLKELTIYGGEYFKIFKVENILPETYNEVKKIVGEFDHDIKIGWNAVNIYSEVFSAVELLEKLFIDYSILLKILEEK